MISIERLRALRPNSSLRFLLIFFLNTFCD